MGSKYAVIVGILRGLSLLDVENECQDNSQKNWGKLRVRMYSSDTKQGKVGCREIRMIEMGRPGDKSWF